MRRRTVIFLSLTFEDETNEYAEGTVIAARGKDSATAIVIDGIALETLDADGEVTATKDLGLAVVQTADGERFVIALTEDEEGNPVARLAATSSPSTTATRLATAMTTTSSSKSLPRCSREDRRQPRLVADLHTGPPAVRQHRRRVQDPSHSDVWSLNNETNLWEFAQLDKESGTFMGNLTQIVDGRSYFVRSTTFDPIEVLLQRFNPQRTPPQYPVFLVGTASATHPLVRKGRERRWLPELTRYQWLGHDPHVER